MQDWFLDTGLWILIPVASAVVGFVILSLAARRVLPDLANRAAVFPWLDILFEQSYWPTRWILVALGVASLAGITLGILAVMDVDIDVVTGPLEEFGLDAARWAGSSGIRIIVTCSVALLIVRIENRMLAPVLRSALSRGKDGVDLEESSKRANALSRVGNYAVTSVVIVVVGVMMLAEFGLNLGPVLAGVGIAGIALAFGAQHLVRDLITGIFIFVEDQYRVGDVASVGGKTGMVEDISLRRTVLRDLDGIVHMIPNGEISTASNFSKTFSRVNLDVRVGYKEDLDHVIRVLNRVGIRLSRDAYFGDHIIDPPQVLRVDSFDDSGIGIKMMGVTKPIRQWDVAGELRRRIKREFDREGIEIPFPHRTIYWGEPTAAKADQTRSIGRQTYQVPQSNGAPLDTIEDPWTQGPSEIDELPISARGRGEDGPDNLMAHLDEVRQLLAQAPFAMFTGIDGTLANLAPEPRFASVSPAVRQALGSIADVATVAILSSRSLSSARSVVGLNRIIYQANHGIESWERGSSAVVPGAQAIPRRIHRLARTAKSSLSGVRGVTVEDKDYSLAIHYRLAANPTAARDSILKFLTTTPEFRGFSVHEGKMVVELRPSISLDKGTALKSVMEDHGIQSALVLGDDLSDVEGFQMLDQLRRDSGINGINAVVMGAGTPQALIDAADFKLADPEAVEIFLEWLAAEIQQMQSV